MFGYGRQKRKNIEAFYTILLLSLVVPQQRSETMENVLNAMYVGNTSTANIFNLITTEKDRPETTHDDFVESYSADYISDMVLK